MNSYTGYVVQTLFTLLALGALAVAVLYAARRAGVGRNSGPLELRGRLALDPRRAIYLVRAGSQIFVVGVAEGTMTKLGELPASDVPMEGGPSSPSFADVLKRAMGRGKSGES